MKRVMVSHDLFWDRGIQFKDAQINHAKVNIL